MVQSVSFDTLSSLRMPDELGIRRDKPRPAEWQQDGYDASFDFLTLICDAFLDPINGGITLICPTLANLARYVSEETLRVDGKPVRIRAVKKSYKFDIVYLSAPAAGRVLSVHINDWYAEIPLRSTDRNSFRDKDCLVTLSRNNDLDWIADWARYHKRHHGCEGLLFYDNGSDAYDLQDLASALSGSDMPSVVRIISANLPFGPIPHPDNRTYESCLLQVCLLNLARLRFFDTARAVLNCDIDELIRPGKKSIFDATFRSITGYQEFAGEWVYPRPGLEEGPRHSDHALIHKSRTVCSNKWCVARRSPYWNKSWQVHSILNSGKLSRLLQRPSKSGFWHCYGISTSWHYDRQAGEGSDNLQASDDAMKIRDLMSFPGIDNNAA